MIAPTRQQITTELTAGRVGGWAVARAQALPWAFDDLTRDLGDDIYERMLLDPQAGAVVGVLRAAVLAEGVRLSPAIDDAQADGYAQSVEIAAFCDSVLADLSTPLDPALEDLLLAIALGSRVAEVVYRLELGRMVLDRIKVKPREATAFVVDPTLNVAGLLAQRPGQASVLGMGAIVAADPRRTPGLLPLDKFMVVTFRPRDSDPRGTSALRPAYNPWWVKQQTWPELLRYLAQFASPSIWGTTAEGAGDVLQPDGSLISPVQALLAALLAWKNGSAAAFPYGTLLHALEVSGDGAPFFRTFDHCDRQITIAVLYQTLATMEGQHGTRAQSETHQDVLGTIIRQARRAVVGPLRRVLRRMVAYNYGDGLARLTPKVSLGDVEAVDEAALWTAVGRLAASSYLHPSQLAPLDRMLGLPVRQVAPGEAADDDAAADGGQPDEEEEEEQTA